MSNNPDRPKGTSSSSFGSPGRMSHDAGAFYNSRLYQDLPAPEALDCPQNPVPESALDKILCSSSEDMSELPDCCLHLMVTSPPYNVGKDYDSDLTLGEYLAFLKGVWKEVYRVLVPSGRACINIANLGRRPYIPLHAFIIQDMIDLGFHMRGEIIWDKGSSASSSTAWGSWLSPSNPTLRDVHEYILVFSKGANKRNKPENGTSTITKDEFLAYSKSVWKFPAVSAKTIGHPAPFPAELPRRLIQFYTFEGDVVLDPFMGSGQVALAAVASDRRYVGYEINPDYVELANTRILEINPSS
jgi:site-specific DNA-methyltransferase (adenine-specific)